MTDDTLREKLIDMIVNDTGVEYTDQGVWVTDEQLEFIHQYAKKYAETIIGQDEPGVTNIMITMEHNHQRALNNEKKGKL